MRAALSSRMLASRSVPLRVCGRSLIAGAEGGPVSAADAAEVSFHAASPATGSRTTAVHYAATSGEIDTACRRAWDAFYAMADRPAKDRAVLLDTAATRIGELGDLLIDTAAEETGLASPRLVSERDRTVATLRMFAEMVREGSWVRATLDSAEPSRRPLAKPDLRRMLRPLGPVAVFGASNFPMAYSTAGGDTASALAAGCPVVVKGHPNHPATGELVARAVASAAAEIGSHPGVFSFLHAGGTRERAVGEEVVRHPCIRAVGFTGSLAGGTALAAIASQRPDPIPVFAEMGSVNPVFILPQALASQATAIAERLVASLTNSNGQMCTCPGIIFVTRGDGFDEFMRSIAGGIDRCEPQPMLSARIRDAWVGRVDACIASAPGVEIRAGSLNTARVPADAEPGPIRAAPVLLRTRYEVFRQAATLRDECFGPSALVVVCQHEGQMLEGATLIQGSLTGSIFCGELDGALAKAMLRVLELRVGRLIFNGVPTGVEVCESTVHGGPFPSSNQPHTTAVGPRAIERWCRPIAYQNCPEALLAPELRPANPMGIARTLDGRLVPGANS